MKKNNKKKSVNKISALSILFFLTLQLASPLVSYAKDSDIKIESSNKDIEVIHLHEGGDNHSHSSEYVTHANDREYRLLTKENLKTIDTSSNKETETKDELDKKVGKEKDSNAPPATFSNNKGKVLDFDKKLRLWTDRIARFNAGNNSKWVDVGAGNPEEARIDGFTQKVKYKGYNERVGSDETNISSFSLKRNGSKNGDIIFCVEADVSINTNHGYRYFKSDSTKGKQARLGGAYAYWGVQLAEEFKGNQNKWLRHMLYTEAKTQQVLSIGRLDPNREIVDVSFNGGGTSQSEYDTFTKELDHAVEASLNYPNLNTDELHQIEKGKVLTLTDDKDYLRYYKIVDTPEGVSAKINGNKLEIEAETYDFKAGDIKLALDVPDKYLYESYLPRWRYSAPHSGVDRSQELVEQGFNDPMEFEVGIEQPFDPFSIVLRKTDEAGEFYDLENSPSLAGAEFTVEFFEGTGIKDKATHTWIYKTDKDGKINLRDEKYFVSGDELYTDDKDDIILPLGTIRITETKSPKGYLTSEGFMMANGEKTSGKSLVIDHMEIGGYPTVVSGKKVDLMDKEVHVLEPMIHGGVKVQKYDSETNTVNPQGDGTFSDVYYTLINKNKHSVIVDGKEYKPNTEIFTKKADKNGKLETTNDLVPYGDYEIIESTSPTGYLIDGKIKESFKIREHKKIVDLTSKEKGMVNDIVRGGVKIQKRDFESKMNQPLGNAKLNAVFTITNRSDHYVLVDGKKYEKDEVVLEIKLDEETNSYTTSKDLLPYGTYEIKEASAPEGYLDTKDTKTFKIREHGEIVDMSTEKGSIYNQVKRGDFYIRKTTADDWKDTSKSQQSMANVEFKVTSKTTGESHVFMTDDNGEFYSKSSWNKHTHDTNGGKEDSGLWFGKYLDEEGNEQMTEPNDELGALPYDWYTIEEIETEANEGYKMWQGEFRISRHNHEVKLNNIENAPYVPEMSTLLATVEGGKVAPYGKEIELVDTITYKSLIVGKEYTARGHLVNQEGEPATETFEVKFTPEETDGIVEVPMIVDTTNLTGDKLVAFEEFELDGKVILEHKDLEDKDQTVEIVEIQTRAHNSNNDSQTVKPNEDVTIIDTITYKNLEVGKEYIAKGKLMTLDKEGKETPFLDKDGEEVYGETTFTPEKRDGEVEVEFTFNTGDVKHKDKIVVFEDLYADDIHYATHSDIEDEDQTITVEGEEVKIGTKATHKMTGLQNILPFEVVTITDEVMYENLVVGQEYTMQGILMDKETGEPLLIDGEEVRSEMTFIPEESEGSVFLDFTVKASDLRGKEVVVFEKLFTSPSDDEEEPEEIANHEDIEDEDQTVKFVDPKIGTKATINGKKFAHATGEVTITDEVMFENLVVGQEYTMQGILMDKETSEPLLIDGEEVRSEVTFTPEESSGSTFIDFVISDSSTLIDKKVVVFEKLLSNNEAEELEEIANHEDIEDEDQTVQFVREGERLPDTATQIWTIGAIGLSLLVIGGFTMWFNRNKDEELTKE